jgi:N-acetylglucosaminyldiphosphoundecaprenol N-acetyl-beta-D-mannosaminyltransferase
VQKAGLEWSFRLAQEPRRLWRRYLRYNPRFVAAFARQLAAHRIAGEKARTPNR